jgi:hypothetical protein
MSRQISFIGLLVFALTALVGGSASLLALVPEPVERAAQKAGTAVTDNWI